MAKFQTRRWRIEHVFCNQRMCLLSLLSIPTNFFIPCFSRFVSVIGVVEQAKGMRAQ
jgi:hypothetical protein